jgi:hypothetical protein
MFINDMKEAVIFFLPGEKKAFFVTDCWHFNMSYILEHYQTKVNGVDIISPSDFLWLATTK